MRRAINIVFVLAWILIAGCDTSSNVDPVHRFTYLKYFGKEGDQVATDILVQPGAGIFLLGNSISLSGATTGYLIKADFEGNVLWERQIGGEEESAVDIELVPGQNATVAVAMNVGREPASRIRILLLTQDGVGLDSAILPMHNFGGFNQVVKSITPLESGEYIITGHADRILIKETTPIDESNDASDILAFRLDNSLNLVDTVVTKGGERDGSGVKVFEMKNDPEGRVVLFSYTDRPFLSNEFGYNFSVDIISSGIPVGQLVGSEGHQEKLAAVATVPAEIGGGYLLAGTSKESEDGMGALYLVRYDDMLQYKFMDQKIPTDRSLECMGVTSGLSGFYVVANETMPGELNDITLMKILPSGSVEWSKSFGSREGDDRAAAIATLEDGRIAMAVTLDLVTKKKIGLIVVNGDGSF